MRTPAEEAESERPTCRECCSGTTSTRATRAALAAYLTARESLAAEGEVPTDREVSLLALFADFAELSRNRPVGEDQHVENLVHSPKERFHTYLQSLDIERAALPDEFRQRLLRVLRHYGVENVDRTRELENAVFQVFLAQQRSAPDVQPVMALLRQWMDEPVPADPTLAAAAREVLDRLVLATQLRFPIVGDLARSAVPLVRPAPRRRRPCRRPGLGPRPGPPARRQPRRRRPRRADRRLAAIPSRSSGSCWSGSRTACPRRSRCSRC